jgi:hypothetical protein
MPSSLPWFHPRFRVADCASRSFPAIAFGSPKRSGCACWIVNLPLALSVIVIYVRVSVFAMSDEIDLKNPKLGAELLKDAKGDLPVDVWMAYFWQHSNEWEPVLASCVDPDDLDIAPIDPQQAVDQAEPLVAGVIKHLMSNSPQEALEAAKQAMAILVHGSSPYQRGRGLPPTMQHQAVRAWVIRKFNPDPTKPKGSTVSWAKLADLLFLQNGKCQECKLTRHQYNSRCVNALSTAVQRLCSAMEHDGISV